jgi:hypothetical protein
MPETFELNVKVQLDDDGRCIKVVVPDRSDASFALLDALKDDGPSRVYVYPLKRREPADA